MEAEANENMGMSPEEISEFDHMTDEELITEIKDHCNSTALDYLINKYRNFVRAKARSYFLIGADREDIIQEGMIGFYKAVRDFRNDKLSSFRAFAELCVTRQIITAIKTATRQKHIPLNSYISLNKPIYDEDSDRTLLDVLSGAKVSDPEELVISQEEFVDIENAPVDGFMVYVDYKSIELTIGAGKFATFYMDQNITLADGTDANIGLYTINGEGINLDNNTVTATKVNDPIAIAGMPLLVYNGTTEQKTVTLRVTPVAPTAGQMWSTYFKGTAVDKTFDADDMAKADYYVLSGGKAFAPVRGTGTIAKNKCWLQFDHETNGSAPARQLTIVFDNGDATGVNEVIEVNEVSDDSWYDLNGRKLNAKPTRKGVYIKNGRKVVK